MSLAGSFAHSTPPEIVYQPSYILCENKFRPPKQNDSLEPGISHDRGQQMNKAATALAARLLVVLHLPRLVLCAKFT